MGAVGLVPLLRAAHFGPTVAVTAVVALLAQSFGLTVRQGAVITAATATAPASPGCCCRCCATARATR